MGNIRDLEGFLGSYWDWEFLNKCFTRGIKVSDIDGIVERNGFFLVLETKRPNAGQPVGQRILFEQMVKTGRFSVIYIWGKPNEPDTITHIEIIKPKVWGKPSDFVTTGKKVSSKGNLIQIVKNWYEKANSSHKLKL